MEPDYWRRRWKDNQIGFHEPEANPRLIQYIDRLGLSDHSRFLIPLCGKTRDIAWLLSQGHRVAGVELSTLAIEQLFDELGIQPTVSSVGKMQRYSARNIDIFVGDIFDLSRDDLGPVDAIYDRGALIALPDELRRRYTAQLLSLSEAAPQLLICLEYAPGLFQGAPFSVNHSEVRAHYDKSYDITLLEEAEQEGGVKGYSPVYVKVWLLEQRAYQA